MSLAHHGGEALLLAAVAGTGVVPVALVVARITVSRVSQRLRGPRRGPQAGPR